MIWMRRALIRLSLLVLVGLISGGASARDLVQTNIDQAIHRVDKAGVPVLDVDGVGEVFHPAWTALYALAYAGVEDYDAKLDLKPDPERFTATIDWLKANLVQDKNGHWVWLYHFDSTYNDISIKAPWSSGFAQAVGIQALLAHWKKTADHTSLDLAKKAAVALFVSIDRGGFLFRAGEDIWFEEIPSPPGNPSHILNGHMRALLAIHELAEATGEKGYQYWFDRGCETLLKWLPLYDAGYWLRYDLNPRKEELLFRLANPYGFANPELAIDRIVLRDPLTGEESVLDVGGQSDAEGALRIAGNDWGQIEQLEGRSVRRLRPVEGAREAVGSEGQMVAPYSYFYLKLPGQWQDNLRKAAYELSVEYYDDKPANLEVQIRSIAPGRETFKKLKDSDLLISGKGGWRQWKINLYPSDLGYWVGQSYAGKHAQYLSSLAKKDVRLEGWGESAFSYSQMIRGSGDFEIVSPALRELPTQTPVLPVYSLDDDGVVLMHMPLPGGGEKDNVGIAVYSPYIIATQAIDGENMAGLEEFLKPLGIDKSRVGSGPALEWLLSSASRHEVDGALLYPFHFDNAYNDVLSEAPWSSAFAQNYVLKALNSAYKKMSTRRDDIKSALEGVVRSYDVGVDRGGIVSLDRAGGAFFEEVPNRTHVFNAQVSGIPALFEAAEILDDGLVGKVTAKGLLALRNNSHLFDTGYWLRYDLNPKKELLFQLDWLAGDASPLIEEVSLEAPQFAKKNRLYVGGEQAFEGATRISGLEWQSVQQVDGRQVRAFANGYLAHAEPVQGGTRHNAYVVMQLPESNFADYFDVQPHRLVIRYKDVAAGKFAVKLQSINEGNVLDFTPLRNSVITMLGDQQWKEAVIEVRPQDMGWYKGADYQVFEVEQLERIAKLTGDWFFAQYAERQRYYLDAKAKGQSVIIQPLFSPVLEKIALKVVDASPTYSGYGFDNALDGDSNNDYVAGLEGNVQEFVVLEASRSLSEGVLRVQWEGRNNYPRQLLVSAVDEQGVFVRELANSQVLNGDAFEVALRPGQSFKYLRLEFSDFVGQPRLLMRLLELHSSSAQNQDESGGGLEAFTGRSKANFIEATDPKNPLSVYRLPVSQEIKDLSDRLVEGVSDDHQRILLFMKYISEFDVGVASTPSPDDTVAERKGACGSFTNTLLALAAAQGMTGRVVSLLNYPVNDGHAVAEIKVGGKWALYDPTYAAFYTLKGSEVPLSFSEIRVAYKQGEEVSVHVGSDRSGVDLYTGRGIFVNANPAGPIGADKPFIFPLELNLLERNKLDASEFGARWQGANFLGAASTNQQQDWVFRGLERGKTYRFEIHPKWLGGDIGPKDSSFALRAELYIGNEVGRVINHVFDFSSKEVMPWVIVFKASSDNQKIALRHDYVGPEYRYMMMQSYSVSEEI